MISTPVNTYIIGFPKCATTSLHRYLDLHPSVYAPIVKEPEYYSKGVFTPDSSEKYLENYSTISENHKIVLDSSASYVYGSDTIPQQIKENTLSEARTRVILLLRNPVDRFVSFFTFLKHMGLIDKNMSIDQFVVDQIRLFEKPNTYKNASFTISDSNYINTSLVGGLYANHLKIWSEEFGSDMRVLSFHRLAVDTESQVNTVLQFLGLEELSDFPVLAKENVTLQHKNTYLQKIALGVYSKTNKYINKNKKLKGVLLSAYKAVNSEKIDRHMKDDTLSILNEFYADDNKETLEILRKIGCDAQMIESLALHSIT